MHLTNIVMSFEMFPVTAISAQQQWRSLGEGPKSFITTTFVQFGLPNVIGEYSAINQGEFSFNMFLVSKVFGPVPWLRH